MRKFRDRAAATTEDLIGYVKKTSQRTVRNNKRQYQVAAFELARREIEAGRSVAAEIRDSEKEARYGYVPREKPDDVY